MKKMAQAMLIIIASMAVGTVQAAKLSWGAQNVSAFGAEYSEGDVVLLVWDSAGDGIDAVNPANGFVADDDVIAKSGTLSAAFTYGSGTLTINPGDVFAGVTTAGANPYSAFKLYVVVYDSATAGTVQNYLVSNLSSTFTVNTSGITTSMIRNAWAEVQPIPEPTTMALAMVGLGVIALRRRLLKK